MINQGMKVVTTEKYSVCPRQQESYEEYNENKFVNLEISVPVHFCIMSK